MVRDSKEVWEDSKERVFYTNRKFYVGKLVFILSLSFISLSEMRITAFILAIVIFLSSVDVLHLAGEAFSLVFTSQVSHSCCSAESSESKECKDTSIEKEGHEGCCSMVNCTCNCCKHITMIGIEEMDLAFASILFSESYSYNFNYIRDFTQNIFIPPASFLDFV